MAFIDVDSINIHYNKFNGNTDGHNLLILHGRGGCSKSRDNVAQKISSLGYDVYVPDLPGFGQTKLPREFSVEDYAHIIESFVNKLGLGELIILGHSNGGRIAIKLTSNGNIKIKKLILNNSAGIKNPPKLKNIIYKKFSYMLKLLSFLPGYKYIRSTLYKLAGGHDYLKLEDNIFLKKTFLNMLNSDLSQDMKKIDLPCILIWGSQDTYTPLSDGQKTHKLIKNSKLIILDGEKHGIHLQNPDRLVKTIGEVL